MPASENCFAVTSVVMMLLALLCGVGCTSLRPVEGAAAADARPGGLLARSSPSARSRAYADSVAPTEPNGDRSRPSLPSRAAPKGSELPASRPSLAAQLDRSGKPPDTTVQVALNFDGDRITTVVEAFATLLDFQYVIDPAVQGTVSIRVAAEMTRAEVWDLMEQILWLGGAYVSASEGLARVMPFAKMPQERRLLARHEPQANVAVQIIPARLVPAATLVSAIQPYLTTGAGAVALPHLNAVLLVEAPANLPKLIELIGQLDQLGETRWPQISLPLRHVDAQQVVDELLVILPILGIPATTRGGDGVQVKVAAVPRLQAVIASAPTEELLAELERWVEVLDREDSRRVERVFFYDVKYNDAEELATAIRTFFTGSGGGPNTVARPDPVADTPAPEGAATDAGGGMAALSDDTGMVFQTPLHIYVDANHNRLVVKTSPRAYATVDALLRRLDTPPLQVLIQVSVAEINLTESTEYGFAYAWQELLGGSAEVESDLDAIGSTGLANLIFRSQSKPNEIFARITAVAGRGNTRVLFAPQVMVLNGEKATINVGDDVPVVTSESNNSDSDNITRDIQFRSTGTILTVTPHITAEHMVRLELQQEVSDAVRTTSSNIDSPTIQTRTLSSTLLIEDRTTLLLGGLISTRNVNSDSGLPILKDLPVVGVPFKNTTTEQQRRELLLLLTVHVVDLDSDVQQLVKRYRAAVESLDASPASPDVPVRDGSQGRGRR